MPKRADDSFVYYLNNITAQIARQFKYKPILLRIALLGALAKSFD